MHSRGYFRFLIVALILLAGGATIWILNIEELVKGPWSNIIGVLFTVVGIILALLQWHGQMLSTTFTQEAGSPTNRRINLSVDQQKGALIIYTKKHLRGTTI